MSSEIELQRLDVTYDFFKVPPQCREHMKLAAGVAQLVMDEDLVWQGPTIDNKDDVILAAALHDLGSIAKWNLRTSGQERFFGPDFDIDYWSRVQQTVWDRYGADDTEATRNMAEYLGVNSRVMKIIDNMGLANGQAILDSNNPGLQITAYSDRRCGPEGIVPVRDRLWGADGRYANQNPSDEELRHNPELGWNPIDRAFYNWMADRLEHERIAPNMKIKPEDINMDTVQPL